MFHQIAAPFPASAVVQLYPDSNDYGRHKNPISGDTPLLLSSYAEDAEDAIRGLELTYKTLDKGGTVCPALISHIAELPIAVVGDVLKHVTNKEVLKAELESRRDGTIPPGLSLLKADKPMQFILKTMTHLEERYTKQSEQFQRFLQRARIVEQAYVKQFS